MSSHALSKAQTIPWLLALITVSVALVLPYRVIASAALSQSVAINSTRAQAAKTRPFTLVQGSKKWTAPATEVRTWFKTKSAADGQTTLQLRPGAIYNYLNVNVSPKINKLGTASRFVRIAGNIHLVGPGSKGQIVDGDKTSLAIRQALVAGKTSATVSLKEHRPAVFSAADFNKLSFPDQLARGETNFAGSPSNRVHNITVATKRYNGLVLMPGEEFSFNQYLGEVDAKNNYLPELVIKNNVTTPEYGGGICQVSTTVFRAALKSGLKITDRRNHSYPVTYYGEPGFDATIYSPYTDLKFKNDTGNPVYITTKILGTRLIFDVRGKSDGRTVTINGPFTTAKRPDGSLTAAIAQFVKKDGKIISEKNFVSNYQSPDKFPIIRAANGG